MSHRLLLSTVVLLGTGCEALSDFTPKVHFDRLDVNEIDFQHADVDFVFQVDNPNPIDVALADFSYALALEEVPFLEGTNDQGFRLEANGASELGLPLDVVFAEVFDTIDATRGKDLVDFRLAGDLGFDTPAGKVDLPYREEGDFPALRTPTFRFQALRVPKVNLTTAEVEVDIGVDNPQGTTLFFDRFDYGLSLGGIDVADGFVSTFAVEGAEEGTLTLPISVNLLSVGEVVLDALDGDRIDLGLNATMDVDTPFGIVPLAIDETGKLRVSDL
jgi:LEA14-like dessication related protein